MPTLSQQLTTLLKLLRTEIRGGLTNKSVAKGFDKYMIGQFDGLLRGLPRSENSTIELLRALRSGFAQYMTLGMAERREIVTRAGIELKRWVQELTRTAEPSISPERSDLSLSDPVLPLVPKERSKAFNLTKLRNLDDLLHYSPKWALDRTIFTPIGRCEAREEPYFILARINGISQTRRGSLETTKVVLEDGSGNLNWVWYNRPYLKRELWNGRWVILHDTPQVSKWGRQVVGRAETYEFLQEEEAKALEAGKAVVFYPSTPTLDQAFWRDLIGKALEKHGASLPKEFLGLHRPSSLEEFEVSRKKLALEELLLLQTFLLVKRRAIERREKGRKYDFEGKRILKFRKTIPYELTGAQKKVLREIRAALAKPFPMNLLLQGDVGSGKTLVAAVAFLYASDSGVQSALLAPTEILSQQHHRNLVKLLEPLGFKIVLLTSDMKTKARKEALAALESGEADLAVGTHALLEEGVRFKDLGFLVIDERHKFGVLQRAALEDKGKWPDCLMMTATPFPRALVLTEYGDTDLSLLDEFPKGRQPIQTFWKGESKKDEVYSFVKARLLKGEQAFWVFPVVDESKNFLKSAIQMHQYFEKDVFHGFRVGLLHGKMKKDEKDEVMAAFLRKEVQLLVATTVVEVGVDVANATVMVVEHAERFGLAQLHQLRGRVGRGSEQSYCFLISSPIISGDAVKRMKTMVSTLDGFKLSEFDLKMRGPGEIFGVAQSGRREGGLVDLKRDLEVVEQARKDAVELVDKDPGLVSPANRGLREKLENRYRGLVDLAQIS